MISTKSRKTEDGINGVSLDCSVTIDLLCLGLGLDAGDVGQVDGGASGHG